MQTLEYQKKYNLAKEHYLNTRDSLTKTCRLFKMDMGCFSKKLKKEGIEVKNLQNTPRMNQYFFDNIDSEEKAYWLGFLYADGYVGDKTNNIELSLKTSDISHLQKFLVALDFQNKQLFQDNVRCRLTFRNKHMHNALIDKGCIPQKSLKLHFPTTEQVPKYLMSHFIRGYVDGDGSVMIGQNHRGERTKPRLSILGTKNFLEGILNETGWKPCKITQPSQCYSIEWGGKYVFQYLSYLYENANIYLDRKYERFLYLKNIFADNKSQY